MLDLTLQQILGQLFQLDTALTAARARIVELGQRIVELEKLDDARQSGSFDEALRAVVEAERTGNHTP